MSRRLSGPHFLEFINGLTKETKELIDNSVETMNDRQCYSLVTQAEDTTEIDEKFVSTVRTGKPQATPEGQKIGSSESFEGYTTIISPLDKETDSIVYSFEYEQGKRDDTQKITMEYNRDVRSKMRGLYNEVNVNFFSLINKGFASAGVDATLSPDSEILFSAAHKFIDQEPTATFDNLMPAVAPSLEVLADLEERAWAFVDVWGRPMSLNPRTILVKRWGKAFREFKKILFPDRYAPREITGANGVNIYEGEYTLIECPYIESSTAYYFMEDYSNSVITDPLYLGFHQRPTIYGSDDYVDSLTHQISMVSYYKVWVRNVPIGLYGSEGR